jgi:hypothetical protein
VAPVLVSVAAIFWPILPDLPMPVTTTLPRLPRHLTMASTARDEILVETGARSAQAVDLDVEDSFR